MQSAISLIFVTHSGGKTICTFPGSSPPTHYKQRCCATCLSFFFFFGASIRDPLLHHISWQLLRHSTSVCTLFPWSSLFTNKVWCLVGRSLPGMRGVDPIALPWCIAPATLRVAAEGCCWCNAAGYHSTHHARGTPECRIAGLFWWNISKNYAKRVLDNVDLIW